MFKYTSRKPVQATLRPGEQPARGSNHAPSIQELGGLLRERREAMGASLAEVEIATRIRQKYLAALESDEWNLLPGEVIGRGFLRNYATYLGLDPTEVIERRRAVADPSLAGALSNVSAGAPLPPMREVDYRPKDVAIRDEPEAIEQRELRLAPIFTVLGLLALIFFVGWGLTHYGDQVGAGFNALADGVQARLSSPPTATSTQTPATAMANNQGGTDSTPVASSAQTNGTPASAAQEVASQGTAGQGSDATTINSGVNPSDAAIVTQTKEIILVPTAIPATAPISDTTGTDAAANTPEPSVAAADNPTPTPTTPPEPTVAPPTETPTETPVPAPAVVAPVCPDPSHTLLTSPGVNEVLAGSVQIIGRAAHENFDRYKLEFAPGAGASDGFTYFAGDANPVDGGVLGSFNAASLPNGAYTLQLTVIDKTGNYPPPCQVSVIVQN